MTTLVLGPSLGTTPATCWGPTAELLHEDVDVVAWELPTGPDPVTVEDLATRLLERVDGPFLYAGDSVGGQVGLQLCLDAPDRVLGAVLCCTAARIGTEESWAERIAQVRVSGTASLVTATAARWFGPGFLEREPERASALLHTLRESDDEGYVAVCGALAAYDVRERLGEIAVPVVAVAGEHDPTCPPEAVRAIADGVQRGRLVVLDGVGHQAPAEAPEAVAALIRELAQEVGA
ncbi:alpha/beta fold hydrolase [Nocardioides anomalus]|uniref:Alpha/beta fold hydrolase n=1 Tax=Nocardioides anomalus TaxID=2712223 RepID=A0A6G6WDB3_9ACTN|nr:alpha/beta fold hydrolase [Nocardioides anomalus]QIG43318.1 alpha/beta fold hydrolase [Nocardioides anomalus]